MGIVTNLDQLKIVLTILKLKIKGACPVKGVSVFIAFEFFRLQIGRRKHDPGRIIWVFEQFQESIGVVEKTPCVLCRKAGKNIMAELTMTATQKVGASIKPVDRKGNPAPVDGVPVWQTDNTDVLALTPSEDGMSCTIAAVGIPGTASVQVTADADMGEGVKAIVASSLFTIVAGEAVSVDMVLGTPEETE